MKVFAISDLHMSVSSPKPMDIFGEVWDNYLEEIFSDWEKKVSQDDVVLISGDISWAMQLDKAEEDLRLLGARQGKKIILRGNHDYWWKSISGVRGALPERMYALQNDSIRLGDYVICGTRGWTVPENPVRQSLEDKKIYNRELLRLKLSLDSAKNIQTESDKLIVMMHFPPFDSRYNKSEFVKMLLEYNVDKVVYGHLHTGNARIKTFYKIDNTEFHLTSCDIVKNRLVEIY